MNSFLKLHEEEISQFVQQHQDGVRKVVETRVTAVHFIGDVIELFFPRLSDTMTVLMGGDAIDPEDTYFTIDETETTAIAPPPFPGSANGNDFTR